MSRLAKVGVVITGYVAAIVAGNVAAGLYNARVATLPYDTSGGMYAGGEMLSSLAAFLVVALVPTLLALWFLRRHERFWNAVAVASLAFAGAGLLAVLVPLVFHRTTTHTRRPCSWTSWGSRSCSACRCGLGPSFYSHSLLQPEGRAASWSLRSPSSS